MDTITIELKNEADTGTPVPTTTVTSGYQEQPVLDQIAVGKGASSQETSENNLRSQTEKVICTGPSMRTTAWGFPVHAKNQTSDKGNAFSAKNGRITLDELQAYLDYLPVHQPPKEENAENAELVAPQRSTSGLCELEGHQEQSTSLGIVRENSSRIQNEPPGLISAPAAFPSFPECPAPGDGCNIWCLTAARACERYGLSPEDATSLIRSQISRDPRGDEVERAVRKAYLKDPFEKAPPSIACSFDEAELRALAYRAPNWGFEDLKNVSPVDVRNCTTIEYLRYIFKSQERVIIATRINDRGTIWINDPDDPNSREDELDSFKHPPEGQGAWFLSNPVNGDVVKLERLKTLANPHGESLRAKENLTSFRYLVLESDEAPQDLWISALVQLPLPIVSIVSSGGKSLHALVRIDAANGEQWSAIKQRIGPALVALGADKNALTDVRLTRLPGSYRAEKDRWQELLYLNPHADETPICELPA